MGRVMNVFGMIAVGCVLALSGCVETANLRVEPVDKKTAIVYVTGGEGIKAVDSNEAMRAYCQPLAFKVIDEADREQLEKGRFQKRAAFICIEQ